MSNPAVKRHLVTFTDFCVILKHGQKGDLIDGVIHLAPPDNTVAGEVYGWLHSLLYAYVQTKNLGRVFGSRIAFRLDESQGPEPDVAFVRQDRLHLVTPGYVDGRPDMAVEIVSPESVERDYQKKRLQYQTAGIPEYWIIDPMAQRVGLLRLDARARYREIRPRKGVYVSGAVSGFWLRPEWLWQDPLPSVVDTLAELLAQ